MTFTSNAVSDNLLVRGEGFTWGKVGCEIKWKDAGESGEANEGVGDKGDEGSLGEVEDEEWGCTEVGEQSEGWGEEAEDEEDEEEEEVVDND